MKIIAYLHTHWDREWYRTFEEFRFRFIEVFDDIVEKLENKEFGQFYLDGQTILIDDLLEIFPDKKDLIKKLIEQKKIVIGPWYTLADEFLVSGECLIRNLLIGTKQAKAFGVNDFIGYLPDAFGHCAGMVDILSSFGIKNALLWRGAGDKKSEFIWKSKSGAEIQVTHLLEGYFQDFFTQNNIKGVKNLLEKIKKNNIGDLVLLPIGADHLAASDDLPQKIAEFNKNSLDFLEIGSVFEYFNSRKDNLETAEGELRDNFKSFILPGTYSTRNYLKRQNTLTTWEIKKIETFLSLCCFADKIQSSKELLDYVWKLLFQNHAHDSICGCSIDSVHSEMEFRYARINQLLETIKQKALTKFSEGENLCVFNTSGFEFSGNVEFKTTKKLKDGFELIETERYFPQKIVQNIHQIPVCEDITNIYTYLARVENIPAVQSKKALPQTDSDIKITANTIENNFLKATFESDGTLTVKDKIQNKIYKNMHQITDIADVGDTYNFSPIIGDEDIKADFKGSKIKFSGKNRAILELDYQINIPKKSDKIRSKSKKLHKIKTQIILDAKSPMLKFKTQFENKSDDHLLQVKFTMPNLITTTVSEDSIGLIKRDFDPNYILQKQQPAENFQELKINTAPMQRFVWAQGVSILTKGIHEYEIFEKNLSITLLRAVGMLSKKKLHTRSNPAGPTFETKEAQCRRNLVCEYAISFCENPNDLLKLADNYFEPTIAYLSSEEMNTQIGLNNPKIYLLAIKEAENRQGIVLRLFNLSEKPQKLNFKAIEVNSEEIQTSPKSDFIDLKPFELKSVLISPNF